MHFNAVSNFLFTFFNFSPFMNRLEDYVNFIKTKQHSLPKYKTLFYDTLRDDILKISRIITNTLNYKNILIIEKNLNKVSEKVTQTLNLVEIDGSKDEILHFEGVKKIIQEMLIDTKIKLEKVKQKKTSLDLELEPEKITKPCKKYDTNLQEELQVERLEIMGNSLVERYRVTRQRLLEIESIQENISEQLNIQDERIDDVIGKMSDIYKSVKNSKNVINDENGSGSFIRRFITILFFCLTFMIIFLHVYYKT